MDDLIKVGIIGGESLAAGELLRLLLNHPAVEIIFVNSESHADRYVTDVHGGLYDETDLRFTHQLPCDEVDVVFFCFGPGESARFLTEHYVPADVGIIDLTSDFRLSDDDNDFVYGLPELNGLQLTGAKHVANPGDFATCAELALLPLAANGWLDGDISVNSIAGIISGEFPCGKENDFAWRTGNLSVFSAFRHPQIAEMLQSLHRLQPSFDAAVDFIPYLGNFTRGIFTTAVTRCDIPEDLLVSAYKDFYEDAAFTQYVDREVDLKQVINTNKCLIHLEKHTDKVLVTACLDHLLKGGAGQAVENMNLMFGLEETTGLMLKSSIF